MSEEQTQGIQHREVVQHISGLMVRNIQAVSRILRQSRVQKNVS